MSRLSFLVTQNTPQIQQSILDFYLQKADRFRAYFPGEEGLLSGSRPDFLALEGVTVQPWSGMVGCIVVEGTLTPAARALIRERGNFDEEGYYHPLQLWSYELINQTEMLLRITDSSVWMVFAVQDELESLEKQNIPTREWQEISLEPEEGVTPLPFDESDLEQITLAMKKVFFPKHE